MQCLQSGFWIIFFWRNADDNATVRILAAALVLTHAIGHNATRFRCGGNDFATRTHAKAVDAAPFSNAFFTVMN